MEVYRGGGTPDAWRKQASLWEALGLDAWLRPAEARPDGQPFIISLAGAGGKTSFIRRLAYEGMERGLRVLVVTTTHMFVPASCGVHGQWAEQTGRMLDKESLAVAGVLSGQGKIAFVGQEAYDAICPLADLVLVEADGSRRLPLKVPGPGEPVIPAHCRMIICLEGMSALWKPGDRVCFRLPQAMEQLSGLQDGEPRVVSGWRVSPADMACLMKAGYLDPLRRRFPDSAVIPVLNQADSMPLVRTAFQILEDMGEADGLVSGGFPADLSAGLF